MQYDNIIQPKDIDAEAFLEGIIRWVKFETPSERHDLIDIFYDHVEASFEALPVERRRIPACEKGAGQLVLTYAPEGSSGKPVALLGHVDTVWAAGTLETMPVKREGDKVYGPGIFDMKAGSFLATETLRRIASQGLVPPRPIVVYLNGDEETGSGASRATIEEIGSEAFFNLIPEPAFGDPGTLITARKGVAFFTFTAHGRSSHAGGNLSDGRSAIHELAHQIVAIEAMNNNNEGSSFNVGTFQGGTRLNVVPAFATFGVDMRATCPESADRLLRELTTRKAVTPDVELEITGELNRPVFAKTKQVARLYDATKALGAALGLDLGETSRGGGSDGNFLAALGLPVLDGFGLNGAGAHAVHEHILVSAIAPRAALIHSMLMSKAFQDQAV
jgi:glutamate carboxypeptidase